MKFTTGSASMVCIYISIRLESRIHVMIGILAPCSTLAVYVFLIAGSRLMSNVYKNSVQFKRKLIVIRKSTKCLMY